MLPTTKEITFKLTFFLIWIDYNTESMFVSLEEISEILPLFPLYFFLKKTQTWELSFIEISNIEEVPVLV